MFYLLFCYNRLHWLFDYDNFLKAESIVISPLSLSLSLSMFIDNHPRARSAPSSIQTNGAQRILPHFHDFKLIAWLAAAYARTLRRFVRTAQRRISFVDGRSVGLSFIIYFLTVGSGYQIKKKLWLFLVCFFVVAVVVYIRRENFYFLLFQFGRRTVNRRQLVSRRSPLCNLVRGFW